MKSKINPYKRTRQELLRGSPKILDIGCGNKPFTDSNILLDMNFQEDFKETMKKQNKGDNRTES